MQFFIFFPRAVIGDWSGFVLAFFWFLFSKPVFNLAFIPPFYFTLIVLFVLKIFSLYLDFLLIYKNGLIEDNISFEIYGVTT